MQHLKVPANVSALDKDDDWSIIQPNAHIVGKNADGETVFIHHSRLLVRLLLPVDVVTIEFHNRGPVRFLYGVRK